MLKLFVTGAITAFEVCIVSALCIVCSSCLDEKRKLPKTMDNLEIASMAFKPTLYMLSVSVVHLF